MSNKEKQTPVSVASTGCSSRIKSYLSLCRPSTQPTPSGLHSHILQQQKLEAAYSTPLHTCSNRGTSSACEAYSEKVRQLELELSWLKIALSTEKRPAGNHKNSAKREAQGRQRGELIKLADGSYLREIKKIGSPWKRLVMQVSPPTIVEHGSTATQVIRAMASMEIDDLYDCLVESMSMGDLSGADLNKIQKRIVMQGSEDGFMEAVVLAEIEKIEEVVTEGLKIQMSSTRREATAVTKIEKERNKGCAVLVMLVQVRDPEECYESVGELMIALVEFSAAEKGEREHHTEGVHVAGVKHAMTTNGDEYYMWSASLEGNCVRNQIYQLLLPFRDENLRKVIDCFFSN